jgi:GAF domain-containing protein
LTAHTATAREITAGDLDSRAEVKSRDEIGILSQTLNTMTENFQQLVHSLEERVRDRTAALEIASRDAARRAAQFETITRVTAAISMIRNLDELLPLVSRVISEQFGYYHVGIFVNDKGSGTTYLIAASSDGGQKMLQRRHSLKIGEQGIVGFVAARGEPRVAHHVGEDAVFFDNPDLPLTKSEAALPLRSATEITGVLDVQSTEEDAFSPDDVRILGVLANHVSLAFEKRSSSRRARRSLGEAETLYRQYVREAWRGAPGEKPVAGYRFTPQRSFPLAEDDLPRMSGDREAEAGTASAATLNIPIQLRGEIIGELVIRGGEGTPWTREQIELGARWRSESRYPLRTLACSRKPAAQSGAPCHRNHVEDSALQ